MRIGIDCRKIADFGIGTYIRGLLTGLEAGGGDEQYVAFIPSGAAPLLPDRFERVIVDAPNYSIREQIAMRRAIGAARLDVFHSPHMVVPVTSCPTVATLHDVILFRFPPANPVARLYVSLMTRRAVRAAVRILTVTEAARRDIVDVLHCDPARVMVTPNGVDPEFRPDAAPALLGFPYFLFVGNDKPHKNLGVLAEALATVRRHDASIRLVLAGASFRRLRSRQGVEAVGFVPAADLPSLYRGAIALVMPSLDEGFGLPAAEAMACGTPVITSQAPALVEVTGEAALHVDARSPGALSAAMLRMMNDEGLRRSLSEKGVARASQFTWRRCAELTRQVYEAVARERHAGDGKAG